MKHNTKPTNSHHKLTTNSREIPVWPLYSRFFSCGVLFCFTDEVKLRIKRGWNGVGTGYMIPLPRFRSPVSYINETQQWMNPLLHWYLDPPMGSRVERYHMSVLHSIREYYKSCITIDMLSIWSLPHRQLFCVLPPNTTLLYTWGLGKGMHETCACALPPWTLFLDLLLCFAQRDTDAPDPILSPRVSIIFYGFMLFGITSWNIFASFDDMFITALVSLWTCTCDMDAVSWQLRTKKWSCLLFFLNIKLTQTW